LDEKLVDYRAAGIPLIWVINPHARYVRIFRPRQRIEELNDTDQLTGDAILPGFTAQAGELFPPRAPAL
jgi:Uma2 family endonuclease